METSAASTYIDALPLLCRMNSTKIEMYLRGVPEVVGICYMTSVGFPGSSVGKESACNAGDLGSIPGSGRAPGEGNGNPLQYSCLENPMNKGIWRATVRRVAESDMTEQLHRSEGCRRTSRVPHPWPCLPAHRYPSHSCGGLPTNLLQHWLQHRLSSSSNLQACRTDPNPSQATA